MNRITLMGRIATDVELKTTQSGVSICTFRMAVDRKYQKKGEDRQTDFFNIVCWRGTAEFVTRWFKKGSLILLEGEMQTRQYTDKSGNAQTRYEVEAETVHFTGEKIENASQEATGSYTAVPNTRGESGDYPF